MKNLSKLLFVSVLLVLMGCASNIKTRTYTDDGLKDFKTFAYLPSTDINQDDFKNNLDKSVEESLVSAMNDEMTARGFTIDKDNPDLVVLLTSEYDVKAKLPPSKDKYQQTSTSGSYSNNPNYASISSSGFKRYSSKGDYTSSERPYKNGALMIEVFDTKSKELVWVGIADDFRTHISDQTLMTRMVNEIFKEFPSK